MNPTRASRFLSLLVALVSSCSGQELAPGQSSTPRVYSENDSVRCAYRDERGRMWFGTNNEGVWCREGQRFIRYSVEDGLSSNHVSAITADDEGNLWFATTRGLTRYDGSRFEHVSIPWDGNEDLWGPGLNANVVLCLLCDRRGDIWLGTWGNGVHRFDPSRRLDDGSYGFSSFLQERGALYGEGEHRNAIQSIVEDRAGRIWLTSMSHGGVALYDGESFRDLGLDEGLSDDMVFSACVARDGDLWFGMLGNDNGGLDHYDGESFEHFTVEDGLGSNNVVCIFEARDGTLWVGSDRSALCHLTRGGGAQAGSVTIAPFAVDGETFKNVLFVAEGGEGGIWFGGRRGRLYHYHEGELTDHTDKR